MFEPDYASESYWRNDADARERSQSAWDELQMRDVEFEPESEIERARRRSPIDEPCCTCDDPANFTFRQTLHRDPDTGYLEGGYYQCNNCGARICEEDYAALCEWKQREARLFEVMKKEPVPAERPVPAKVA